MSKRLRIGILLSVVALLVGCAVITVNVYFPEKDINQAYTTLEDELMKAGQKKAPDPAKTDDKQSSVPFLYRLITPASAADIRGDDESGLSKDLVIKIKANPDVVQAYKSIGERLGQIDGLRGDGTVGEGNNGLLVIRADEEGLDKRVVKSIRDENRDRSVIMAGMAKAMREVRNLPDNEENRKETLKQATDQFAKLRSDKAKSGWWVQAKDGKWAQKK